MDHIHHFLPLLLLLPCTVMCTAVATVTSSSDSAYPTVTEDCSVGSGEAVPVPVRREVYDNGRIFDISHRYTAEMPSFASENGRLGSDFLWLGFSIKNGSLANASMMKFCVHSGTHVDTPGHVFDHYYHAGFDVDALDLEVLNGPALVVDVPRDKNITAEVMKALNIPKGVRRVLFRTLNTDRKIMWNVAYDTSATGFTEDGAKWLVQNTDIKLVGIDYLNVAAFVDVVPVHNTFLEGREIILVEGLKLEGVPAGLYSSVHCLPLRLIGSDGSPARCILIK